MNRLNWLMNDFINKELYAPFVVKNDVDYYKDLRKKYNLLYKLSQNAGADSDSLFIIRNLSDKICKAIRLYYKGNITTANRIVKNIISDCASNRFAVSPVYNSDAFKGVKGTEIPFFRGRLCTDAIPYTEKEMLHIPFSKRGITKNYRFSISGLPCLYIGNSSYVCWLELGRPAERDLVVAPIVIEDKIIILNLAVMTRDFTGLREFDEKYVHCWLKLLILMIATSYRIEEKNRFFHSEYIISQSIMLACHELGIDGVAYYSNRTEDHIFASTAINVALLADYKFGKEYSDLCKSIKVGKPINYGFYRQLSGIERSKHHAYPLRSLHTGFYRNIGYYDSQFDYANTDFCEFDKFLFGEWEIDKTSFGNALLL